MKKLVEITVDIPVAKRMLGVAGFYNVSKMTDEEVFAKVLAMMERYGGKADIKEYAGT